MKTFCSTYIKKPDMLKDKTGEELKRAKEELHQLEEDIKLYSWGVRKMTNDWEKPRTGKKESIHVEYTHTYGFSDYFVTSIEQATKGIRASAKENLSRCIDTCKQQISQMEEKIKNLREQIKKAEKIKQSLIARSEARKEKKKLPAVANYFGSGIKIRSTADGSLRFEVKRNHPSKKKRKRKKKTDCSPLTFENEYLFETLYLDPYIKNKKRTMHQIQGRLNNTKRHLEKLERQLKSGHVSICFGGKELSRQRHRENLYVPHWRAVYDRKRLREMVLVGRKDATQGNFMVRYDIDTYTLRYTTTKKTVVTLPGVRFPYGQESINTAVSSSEALKKNRKLPLGQQLPCWGRMPVTWSIKDCGNAFLVKCMIEVPENEYMNTDYSVGCIGVDKNYDHFAVAEVNRYGQMVNHFVIPFKMDNMSSDQVTNNISEALEKVFHYAVSAKKPIVVEEIQDIRSNFLYGNPKANRKISQFAYGKMDLLIESKSQKYGIAVRKINPAYTSQIGKIKYMKAMGLSVHESAAFVIARRGMGFKERVPDAIRKFIPKTKIEKHHWVQWAGLTRSLKEVPVHRFYGNVPYSESKTMTKLKEALLAG